MMTKFLTCVAVLAVASASFGGTTIFTNEPGFLNVIQPGYYLEDFSTFTNGNPLDGSQTDTVFGPVNGWSWDAHADNGLWSNTSALSTNSATNPLILSFSPLEDVTAVGGVFASTDIDGNTINQAITVLLSDGTSYTLTGQGFIGFASDVAITSLTATTDNSQMFNWPQLDHFYVGSDVPEPVTLSLLGLGGLGLLFRRRRK